MIYNLPNIVIFKWSYNGTSGEELQTFTSFDAAYEAFLNMTVRDFPNRIIFIEHEGANYDRTHTMTWREFMDKHKTMLSISQDMYGDAA